MSAALAVSPIPATRRTATNAFSVALCSTAAKVAGALKIAVIAHYFGATDGLDAFLIAFALPAFFADAIAGCLTAALVPVLIRVGMVRGERAMAELAAAASSMCAVGMVAVAMLLAASAPVVVPALGSGFSAAKLGQTIVLFRLLLLWLPISAYIAGWRALLNSCGNFVVAAAAPILTPAVVILALVVAGPGTGSRSLCVGTLVGAAAELVVLASALRWQGMPVRVVWLGWTSEVADTWRGYLPLTAASLVFSASALIDQAVAGTLAAGSVAALAYGNRIVAVCLAIVANACATTILPPLSRLVANRNWRGLGRTMALYVGGVFTMSLPVITVLIHESRAIVRVLFEHGGFDAGTTELVTATQQCALLQVPFAVAFALVSRLCLALGMGGVLARVAVLGLVANVAGDLALTPRLGVAGIAASTACVQALSLLCTVATILHRYPQLLARRKSGY